ncbi:MULTISPECIES: GNAT family N-acetyltransferase [Chelativorans]|jgi:putative acetyltransferase|uniref:GCN5-related N-acetyltransferase n=1 Tax=Chelativorans sp. (strain BNC1) TaxID=266779 RepID=Q11LC9_CHESB|nr:MULTISPECIES: N-acetyltransferase [Chelativorans]
MSAVIIRPEEVGDETAIRLLLVNAFGGEAEARLVDELRSSGEVVLSLVAERDGEIRGHILFSRLWVHNAGERFAAVALAPLAVHPGHQHEGIGSGLVEDAHARLEAQGEKLSLVHGEPAYYGRFGYSRERAAGFETIYQGEYLQARAWDDAAPAAGRLDYPQAFADIG